jgi:hypothetical protein
MTREELQKVALARFPGIMNTWFGTLDQRKSNRWSDPEGMIGFGVHRRTGEWTITSSGVGMISFVAAMLGVTEDEAETRLRHVIEGGRQ